MVTNYTESALDHDQESNSEFLNDFWKAALMGYGSGLCIGLSIIYIMISTGNLKWHARIIEGMEQGIITWRRKKQRESLELPCRYQVFGCQDVFTYHSRHQHEQNCKFHPYNFP
ncbi:hypothetical protein H5410_063922 [Solanum commersonii]|uniref:SIAH-type domain-containing protein n=1 Tax=Solanum commersonii TaxID=4109 RepID=A0A9J5WG01_SOLCO|nr:hypothetical protein H5410_063922 [Solanum commersonii]